MFELVFKEAIEVIRSIERNGFKAYIVGGAVRDYFLNKSIHDVDIATSATPEDIQRIFPKVIPVGIEHGTVIVRQHHQSFEVTTFRTEDGYSDYRHPDHVRFVNSITEDLARRDFTINAMAMTKNGEIVDPFHGIKDLEKKVIRAVGNPNERFLEDPLRMMRAIRFMSQLDFELEDDTFIAIKGEVKWLNEISIERVAKEFEKTIAGYAVHRALKVYTWVDLWTYLPVFNENKAACEALSNLCSPLFNLVEVFTYLKIKVSGLNLRDLTCLFKQSNQTYRSAAQLVALLTHYKANGMTNRLIYQLPENLFESFIHLTTLLYETSLTMSDLVTRKKSLPLLSRRDMKVTGHDVIDLFPKRKKGKWIQHYLNEIEYQIVENKLANDESEIKEWIKRCHPPENN